MQKTFLVCIVEADEQQVIKSMRKSFHRRKRVNKIASTLKSLLWSHENEF